MRYLFDSFSYDVPWKSCTLIESLFTQIIKIIFYFFKGSKAWNTECCAESLLYSNASIIENAGKNFSANFSSIDRNCSTLVDPITEYWEYV